MLGHKNQQPLDKEFPSFYHFDAFSLRSGPHYTSSVTKIAGLSLCNGISRARKVKMRHCKRQESSTQCGNCREGWWDCLTPLGWSGSHQEGSFLGQFVPIRPVLVVFSAKNTYQTIGLGVVIVGKG